MASEGSFRSSRILAAANVLALVALLAGKAPEYEQLRAQDERRTGGGIDFIESEAPLYVAARPLYVGGLVVAPLVDRLFALVNIPAILATVVVSLPVGIALSLLGGGSQYASSVSESWVTAAVLLVAVATWGLVVGAVFDCLAHRPGAA